MNKYNDSAIAEAAYYIWQNNGCPANTSAHDWNAAINQLNAMSAIKNASKKLASAKTSNAKRTIARAASLKSSSLKAVVLNPSAGSKKTVKKSK